MTLRSTEDDYRNYLAVASVKIDTSLQRGGFATRTDKTDDEGFYSSSLNIYQVDWEQKKFKMCFTEWYVWFKRSITCIASYLGNLIATLKSLKLQAGSGLFHVQIQRVRIKADSPHSFAKWNLEPGNFNLFWWWIHHYWGRLQESEFAQKVWRRRQRAVAVGFDQLQKVIILCSEWHCSKIVPILLSSDEQVCTVHERLDYGRTLMFEMPSCGNPRDKAVLIVQATN